jgi:hypothetical protein
MKGAKFKIIFNLTHKYNNRDMTRCGINTNVHSTNNCHTATARILNDLQNNVKIWIDPGYAKTSCCRCHYEN